MLEDFNVAGTRKLVALVRAGYLEEDDLVSAHEKVSRGREENLERVSAAVGAFFVETHDCPEPGNNLGGEARVDFYIERYHQNPALAQKAAHFIHEIATGLLPDPYIVIYADQVFERYISRRVQEAQLNLASYLLLQLARTSLGYKRLPNDLIAHVLSFLSLAGNENGFAKSAKYVLRQQENTHQFFRAAEAIKASSALEDKMPADPYGLGAVVMYRG